MSMPESVEPYKIQVLDDNPLLGFPPTLQTNRALDGRCYSVLGDRDMPVVVRR
jgi:hypothetical protein